jgi:predicted RecB family nuclease
VFLDVETDLGQSYIWLVGLCAGREGECQSLFAESPAYEKRILLDFLSFMERYPAANILTCSGSRFDERMVRRRLSHYGLSTAVCDRMIDLHRTISRAVALPTSSYRVKEIGTFFGYRYKHSDLDGFRVASLYEGRYQQLRNPQGRRKLALRLREYNEDDVRCLPFILRAIEDLPKAEAEAS